MMSARVFVSAARSFSSSAASRQAKTITQGVSFDTSTWFLCVCVAVFLGAPPNAPATAVAREWRFKWSTDNDKASLAAAQKVLEQFKGRVKSVPGVKSVQRVVCGGCQDFKVIVALDAAKFGAWDATKFAPEQEFLGKERRFHSRDLPHVQ